nr:sodium:solute symporter [Chenggangzhangella methanolivorans]
MRSGFRSTAPPGRFFGAVGFAASAGWSFLALSIGPALALALFTPALKRIVRLAKERNITSIADFIGARYGKSERVAGLVAVVAIVGATPYVALQLKAIATSVAIMAGPSSEFAIDPALVAAAGLALFAMLFGARQVAATERQEGLMLAVAVESVVKLAAFLIVGGFVTFWLFDGYSGLIGRAAATAVVSPFATAPSPAHWVALTALSFAAFLLLPRQFHVAVVENRDEADVGRAAYLFPAYLVAFNLFVPAVALAGLVTFGGEQGISPDSYVLALPLEAGARWIAVAAFLGGLSAASAMVIVECVALAVMMSNDLAMPVMLRRRSARRGHMAERLLLIRRISIVLVMGAAYGVSRIAGATDLSSLGLIAMAAIAQLAPVFFGGLAWTGGNARGAIAGLLVGLALWGWTLVLPACAFGQRGLARGAGGERPMGRRVAASAGDVRRRFFRPPHPWRRHEPAAQCARLCRCVGHPRLDADRAAAGARLLRARTRRRGTAADGGELPALALARDCGRARPDRRALSRGRTHRNRVSRLRHCARRGARAEGRSRPPDAALRRAPARLGDRRRLLPPRALDAADQAQRHDDGRAEAARRRLRRDADEPRRAPERARPRPPGRHRDRRRHEARVLEPAVPRTVSTCRKR